MKIPLWYLASPYSHVDPIVREHRYLLTRNSVGKLLSVGVQVISPIVHWHAAAVAADLPTDFGFWQPSCLTLLDHCDGLLQFTLDGWEKSEGMAGEVAHAFARSKPVIAYSIGYEWKVPAYIAVLKDPTLDSAFEAAGRIP